MLVILWKSSLQALQKCVRPKQKNTATEQQQRPLYSRKSDPCLDTSEVNQIRGKMQCWSLEEFGWKKTHCLQNVLIKNCSYLLNSLNVVLTLLFADHKTSCKTKNRDRTPCTVFLLGKRTLEDAIVTLFWSGRLSQMNEQ